MFLFRLKRYTPKIVIDSFQNTSKLAKNTLLRVVFSTLFLVFGNVVKHGLSCLIYRYMTNYRVDMNFAFPGATGLIIIRTAWNECNEMIDLKLFYIYGQITDKIAKLM